MVLSTESQQAKEDCQPHQSVSTGEELGQERSQGRRGVITGEEPVYESEEKKGGKELAQWVSC